MGLFSRKNLTSEQQQQAADRWALIGATLSDTGAALGGGQGGNIQKVRSGLGNRALDAQIASTITDPRELALYRANPTEWAKARASGFEAANVSGGDSRFIPGQGFLTAPKLVVDAGIYGTQTPTGYTATGARGPSIAEGQTAQRDAQDYVAKMTPEGFLPRMDDQGRVVGFDVDPGYKNFSLQKAASGATRVNVPITLPAQNKFAEAFATQYAQDLSKSRDVADTADEAMTTLSQAKDMLGKGMYTGAAADARLALGKVAALVNPGIRDKVANTEAFQAVMGQQVLNIAKQLGSGTGISNADREFAAKVAGGSINLDAKTIDRLINIQQQRAQSQIKKFQQRGAEAFQSVPSAQGLPSTAFSGPPRKADAASLKKKYGLE